MLSRRDPNSPIKILSLGRTRITLIPQLCIRNHQPETRNQKSATRNPKPETRNSKPETRNPKRQNPKSSTLNPKPETRNRRDPSARIKILSLWRTWAAECLLDATKRSTSPAPRLRGGLIFKAHRLLYHSTIGSNVLKKGEVPCTLNLEQ